MPDLLTSAQVADLAGIHRSYVAAWAEHRGITGTRTKSRAWRWPATEIHIAIAYERRPPPPAVRLARFIRNPLNH